MTLASAVRRRLALLGAPTDINSSFLRGAAKAPPLIRRALYSPQGNAATESGLELGRDIDLEDRGDLALTEAAADDQLIERGVAEILRDGRAPIVLGGDHAITHAILRAICGRFGPVSILHFDAHPDIYEDFEGNPRSHASPFARIMEAGLASRLVQVGIRTLSAPCRPQIEKYGVEVVPMRDFHPDNVPTLDGPLYVSFDLDGLDPACAPGVAHPEPGGLSVRQALDVLARIKVPVIGADIVEYNPVQDVNGVTAVVAAKMVKEIAALAVLNGEAR